MAQPHFATFWQGSLSGFEAACISSFVRRGYPITVYSYRPLDGLPEGAVAADAATIAPAAAMGRFLHGGRPHLSQFSDYFRYLLFAKTDAIWVDTDVLMVRRFDEDLPDTLFARERQAAVCNAVLRIGDGPALRNLIATAEGAMDRDMLWGEIGGEAMEREFGRDRMLAVAYPAERFFSIDHDNFWKAFLPRCAAECERTTEQSWGVHLWNNVVDRMGVWKRFAPPRGSYLHSRWAEDGSLHFFADEYPVEVMEQLVENWRYRQSGEALGIRQIARQAVPSIGRTVRHYVGAERSLAQGARRLRTRFSNA